MNFNRSIKIGDKSIGNGNPVFIIAEAGVAHFGNLNKAKQLVDLAVAAKADAIKFQIFKTDELISIESHEWIDRLQSRELPFLSFEEIQSYCNKKGIINY